MSDDLIALVKDFNHGVIEPDAAIIGSPFNVVGPS